MEGGATGLLGLAFEVGCQEYSVIEPVLSGFCCLQLAGSSVFTMNFKILPGVSNGILFWDYLLSMTGFLSRLKPKRSYMGTIDTRRVGKVGLFSQVDPYYVYIYICMYMYVYVGRYIRICVYMYICT